MESHHRKELERLALEIECGKDLKCLTNGGLIDLCKAKVSVPGLVLKCVSLEQAKACNFSVPFNGGFLCQCPLRQYFAEKMGHQMK